MTESSPLKKMLNKVPEVTLYFWIIKVLCTTIGETAADYLNSTFNFGLTGTSLIMGALLVVVLIFQFRSQKYIPSIYWLAVVLLSVVGTLITDNLIADTDALITNLARIPLAIFVFILYSGGQTKWDWFSILASLSHLLSILHFPYFLPFY